MPPSRQGNVNTESVDNYLKAILALSGTHCIPAMDGKMPKQLSKPLTDLHEQGAIIVDSVSDENALC